MRTRRLAAGCPARRLLEAFRRRGLGPGRRHAMCRRSCESGRQQEGYGRRGTAACPCPCPSPAARSLARLAKRQPARLRLSNQKKGLMIQGVGWEHRRHHLISFRIRFHACIGGGCGVSSIHPSIPAHVFLFPCSAAHDQINVGFIPMVSYSKTKFSNHRLAGAAFLSA